MKNVKFRKISWNEFEADCFLTAKKLKGIKIDKIVAISRGGLVPARIFSDLLNIPISSITMQSYKDMKQVKEPYITEAPTKTFENETILIIDEIADTGKTFKRAISYFSHFPIKKVYTLAPYIKPQTKFTPDFWGRSYKEWIVFPYDFRETKEALMKYYKDEKMVKAKMLKIGYAKKVIEDLFKLLS